MLLGECELGEMLLGKPELDEPELGEVLLSLYTYKNVSFFVKYTIYMYIQSIHPNSTAPNNH